MSYYLWATKEMAKQFAAAIDGDPATIWATSPTQFHHNTEFEESLKFHNSSENIYCN